MAATKYTGTRNGDRLTARTSGDTLEGQAGNDLLSSGTTLLSGVYLLGGEGNDTLVAKSSDALIDGGAGLDTVQFAAGVASLANDDAMVGVEKVQITNTESAAYVFTSQTEALEITGGRAADNITGGGGNDTITGGLGADSLNGGAGNDVIAADAGDALIDGGVGDDTVSFAAAVSRSSSGVAQLLDADLVDVDDKIAIVITNTGNAAYDFADQSEKLDITGGRGKDTITGGSDVDTLRGGNGNDLLIATASDALVDGGAGNDTVRYGAGVSGLTDAQLVNVEYVVATAAGDYNFVGQSEGLDITGTGSADTIRGGSGADALRGGLGDDKLYAADNDKLIDGGNGDDTAYFTASVSAKNLMDGDLINVEKIVIDGSSSYAYDFSAQSEKLSITGGAGADTLTGGKGADTIRGGSGNDVIVASDLDVIDGGNITDTTIGAAGNDTVRFAAGVSKLNLLEEDLVDIDNIVITNSKAATYDFSVQGEVFNITGGSGNDTIVTKAGTAGDTIDAGAGNDVIVADETDFLIDGGSGIDTVLFAADVTSALLLDDDLANAENVVITDTGGGSYDFSKQTELLQITGNSGVDVIVGGFRSDTIIGGAGADQLSGYDGADLIVAETIDTLIHGGDGDDTVRFAAAVDSHASGSADNWLQKVENVVITNTGNAAYDFGDQTEKLNIVGNSGSDTITGGGGADTLSGGAGNDLLVATENDVLIDGGVGTDTARFGANVTTALLNAELVNVERIELTATGSYDFSVQTEALTITGSGSLDTIQGGTGADSISGGDGADKLYGNQGADTLQGGLGIDSLVGGDGVDYLHGGDENDVLVAQDIDGRIDGGSNTTVGGDIAEFGADVSASNLADTDLVEIETIKITNTVAGSYDFSAQSEALVITGGVAKDVIIGGRDWDEIDGGTGAVNDTLTGGVGGDTLKVTAGTDTITDLETDDVLLVSGSATVEAANVSRFVATAGSDNDGAAILNAAAAGSLIDLTLETGSVGYTINGGAGVDSVTGSGRADIITGAAGADKLYGGNGNDVFIIATPADHPATETIVGDGGTDVIRFTSTAAATLTLSANVDVEEVRIATAAGLDTGTTAENLDASSAVGTVALYGNAGANTLTGNALDNTIEGGAGADIITGGLGADSLHGGDGADEFRFASRLDIVNDVAVNGGNQIDTAVIAAVVDESLNLNSGFVSNLEKLILSAGTTATATVTLDAEMTDVTVTSGIANIQLSAVGQDVTGSSGADKMTVRTTEVNLAGGVIDAGTATDDTLVIIDKVLSARDLNVYATITDFEKLILSDGSNANATVTLDTQMTDVTVTTGAADVTLSAVGQDVTGSIGAHALKVRTSIANLAGSVIDAGTATADTLVISDLIATARDLNSYATLTDVEKLELSLGSTATVTLDTQMTDATVTSGAADITLSTVGQDVYGASNGALTVRTTDALVAGSIIIGGYASDKLVISNPIGIAVDLNSHANLTAVEILELAGGSSARVTLDVQMTQVVLGDAATIELNTDGQSVNAQALTDGEILTLTDTATTSASVTLAGGDLVASAYDGNLTVTATAGSSSIITGAGSDTVTGGAGADVINLGAGLDKVIVAAGDTELTIGESSGLGTIVGYDTVYGFSAASVTAFSETLEITTGSTVVVSDQTFDGINSSLTVGGQTIKSHKISSGIISFDDVETYSSALAFDATAAQLATAVQYLQAQDWGNAGATLAFVAADATYVFMQGTDAGADVSDVLVKLVGVYADSLITTNAIGANDLYID